MGVLMDRRSFLSRIALVAAGVVAADQLEILARLGWTRTLFPSAAIPTHATATQILAERSITDAELNALFKRVYSDVRTALFPMTTPLLAAFDKQPRSLYAPKGARWGGQNVYRGLV